MSKTIFTVFAAVLALGLATGSDEGFAAKKNKRDSMSEAQKKKLRKNARDYCLKTYAKGTATLERVEIQQSGKVICWIRQ
jgi:hypothetical protein